MGIAAHGGDIYDYNRPLLDFSANLNPLGMPEAVSKAAAQVRPVWTGLECVHSGAGGGDRGLRLSGLAGGGEETAAPGTAKTAGSYGAAWTAGMAGRGELPVVPGGKSI